MYETLQQIYGDDGVLIPAGQLVKLSDKDAAELMKAGFVKRAVYTVEIKAPDEVTAKKIQAETEARIRQETEIALAEKAKQDAALEAATLAEIEGKKAEAFLSGRKGKKEPGATVVPVPATA